MIRHVVLGRLAPGVQPAELQPALDAIAGLRMPGLVDIRAGLDQRLRDGTWDFAITADLVDEEAFRAYDRDPEHDRIRRDELLPRTAQLLRVQFATQAAPPT